MDNTYTYPDPHDIITAKIIEQYQIHHNYWEQSEKWILQQVDKTIQAHRFSNYTLLDAGCGEGRLFAHFIKKARQIKAIEPDKQRYENACLHVQKQNFNAKVSVLHSTLEDCYFEEPFDVVLSSHILQHLPTYALQQHLQQLANYTKPGGLLVITTNVSNHENAYFMKSYLEHGEARESEISEEEFNRLTKQSGQLPIHMFDRKFMQKTMQLMGFDLHSSYVFHMAPEIQRQYGPAVDQIINQSPDLQGTSGRDICFIFRKRQSIKYIHQGALAEFCAFNINLYGIELETLTTLLHDFKKQNEQIIHTSPFCLSPINRNNARQHLGRNINTRECLCGDQADSFCSTGQTINRSYRYYIGTTYFKFFRDKLLPLKISITFFPYRNIGIVCFNVIIKHLSVDEVIALKQYFSNTSYQERKRDWRNDCRKFFSASPDNSLTRLEGQYFWFFCNNLVKDLSKIITQKGKKSFSRHDIRTHKEKEYDDLDVIIDEFTPVLPTPFIYPTLEINQTDISYMENQAHQWAVQHKFPLYGLLVGDEGYEYIPKELAFKRISQFHWGTRQFVYIFAYGSNSILLNFKAHASSGIAYIERQKEWSEMFYDHNRNLYFSMSPCIAGIDHGLFRSIERNIIVYYENDYISKIDQSSAIHLNKKRNKILLFLYKTTTALDEINDLFHVISQASGTADTIETIKQRLSLRSEEKTLKNQRDNNGIMLTLTFTSLILGFLAITTDSSFLSQWASYVREYNLGPYHLLISMFIIVLFMVAIFLLTRMINWSHITWKLYRYLRKKRRMKN